MPDKCVNLETPASQSMLVSVNIRNSKLFSHHTKRIDRHSAHVTFCIVFSVGAINTQASRIHALLSRAVLGKKDEQAEGT